MASNPARPWVIEKLVAGHDRTIFDCGHTPLNDWLKLRSSQFAKKDLARTYVAVLPGQSAVLGYYAISTHRVSYDALPPNQAKETP